MGTNHSGGWKLDKDKPGCAAETQQIHDTPDPMLAERIYHKFHRIPSPTSTVTRNCRVPVLLMYRRGVGAKSELRALRSSISCILGNERNGRVQVPVVSYELPV